MIASLVITIVLMVIAIAIAIIALQDGSVEVATAAVICGIGYSLLVWGIYAAIHFILKFW